MKMTEIHIRLQRVCIGYYVTDIGFPLFLHLFPHLFFRHFRIQYPDDQILDRISIVYGYPGQRATQFCDFVYGSDAHFDRS